MKWISAALAAIGSAIAAVFMRDIRSDEPVRRHYPVMVWGRKGATWLGPLLRQYWIEPDEDERPFNRTQRNWINATSRGKVNTLGFGSQYDYSAVGSIAFTPRTFTNKASTLSDEVGSGYRRIIGGRGTPPIVMPHFVYVSGMSYGALSERAITALNRGAAEADIFHNTGEGGLSPAHLQGGGLIFQIGTAKYGIRDDDGNLDDDLLRGVAEHDEVRLFEVKLAQGAKPGKGGMLLKEKITPEIATVRKVPLGKDAISPPRHREFDDVDGLFDFLDHVRSVTNKPAGIKLVIGNPSEIDSIAEKMAAEPERGPDFITIDGGEGGSGAAPVVLASYAGLPLRQALTIADRTLREHGVREDVTLFASGKLGTPAEAALAMALGADAVGVARGMLISLGCIQSLRCHENTCPTGIATQDARLQKVLDTDGASERVARYTTTLVNEITMLARSCGYEDPTQLTPDDVLMQTEPGRFQPLSQVVPIDMPTRRQEGQ